MHSFWTCGVNRCRIYTYIYMISTFIHHNKKTSIRMNERRGETHLVDLANANVPVPPAHPRPCLPHPNQTRLQLLVRQFPLSPAPASFSSFSAAKWSTPHSNIGLRFGLGFVKDIMQRVDVHGVLRVRQRRGVQEERACARTRHLSVRFSASSMSYSCVRVSGLGFRLKYRVVISIKSVVDYQRSR